MKSKGQDHGLAVPGGQYQDPAGQNLIQQISQQGQNNYSMPTIYWL